MSSGILRHLSTLFEREEWQQLVTDSVSAQKRHPQLPEVYGFAAHALRHLRRFEEGYEWAKRGQAIAPDNLFVVNRVSLLGNLTGRFDEVFDLATHHASKDITADHDRINLATIITNGIHACAKLGRIDEGVTRFTPAIERIDHPFLHFNAACLYALANDARWFRWAEKSLEADKPLADFADGDFDAVRAEPRFARLLARDWKREREALVRARVDRRELLRPEHFVDLNDPEVDAHVEPRNVDLETAIDASPDDATRWQVLHDWLLERQTPRAESWLRWNRWERATEVDERMLACAAWATHLEENAGTLLGPVAEFWNHALRWRGGFIEHLRVDPSASDFEETLRDLANHPACRFLRGLEVRDIAGGDAFDYGDVLDTLSTLRLPCLRSLRVEPDDDTRSWAVLTLTDVGAKFPQLESLELGAGGLSLGALRFPSLTRFALRTTSLTHSALASVMAAQWPRLRELELWFGSTEYGADTFERAEIERLLAGIPSSVSRLGLKNSEFTDALIEALANSKVLQQLTHLDLSMGIAGDVGAVTLQRNAQRFHHLEVLELSENCFSAEAVAELKAAFPNAVVGQQKTHRYVSVGE